MNFNTEFTHTQACYLGWTEVLYSDLNKLWRGHTGLSLSQVNYVINEAVAEWMGTGVFSF